MTPREETARIIVLVPNEGLNDSSRGNCGMIILVPNECLNDSSSEKCRIVILVPNECLNDSSSGKCRNNNAAVGRRGDTT